MLCQLVGRSVGRSVHHPSPLLSFLFANGNNCLKKDWENCFELTFSYCRRYLSHQCHGLIRFKRHFLHRTNTGFRHTDKIAYLPIACPFDHPGMLFGLFSWENILSFRHNCFRRTACSSPLAGPMSPTTRKGQLNPLWQEISCAACIANLFPSRAGRLWTVHTVHRLVRSVHFHSVCQGRRNNKAVRVHY